MKPMGHLRDRLDTCCCRNLQDRRQLKENRFNYPGRMIHLRPDAGFWQQAETSSSYRSEAGASTCLLRSEAVCSVPYAQRQRVRGEM